jgi:hypothetical protein
MAKTTGLQGKNYKYDFNVPTAMRLGSFHSKVPPAVASEINGLLEKMKSGSFVAQPV